MIIKMEQVVGDLQPYVRKDRFILAKRMREDFMIETVRGWEQGRTGEWLINISNKLWSIIADDQFNRIYVPYDATVHDLIYGDGNVLPERRRPEYTGPERRAAGA